MVQCEDVQTLVQLQEFAKVSHALLYKPMQTITFRMWHAKVKEMFS